MKQLIALLLYGIMSTAAVAMQPTISGIELGPDMGKPASCVGHLYMQPQRISMGCPDGKSGCVSVLIEKCPIRNDVDAVHCTTGSLPESTLATLMSSAINRTAMEERVLDAMKREGAPFKQADTASIARYKKLMTLEIEKNLTLSVKGNVDSCSSCENCYPHAQCELSQCEIKLLSK